MVIDAMLAHPANIGLAPHRVEASATSLPR